MNLIWGAPGLAAMVTTMMVIAVMLNQIADPGSGARSCERSHLPPSEPADGGAA